MEFSKYQEVRGQRMAALANAFLNICENEKYSFPDSVVSRSPSDSWQYQELHDDPFARNAATQAASIRYCKQCGLRRKEYENICVFMCSILFRHHQLWDKVHPHIMRCSCVESGGGLGEVFPSVAQFKTVLSNILDASGPGRVVRVCVSQLQRAKRLPPMLPMTYIEGDQFIHIKVNNLGADQIFGEMPRTFTVTIPSSDQEMQRCPTPQDAIAFVLCSHPLHREYVQSGRAVCIDKFVYKHVQQTNRRGRGGSSLTPQLQHPTQTMANDTFEREASIELVPGIAHNVLVRVKSLLNSSIDFVHLRLVESNGTRPMLSRAVSRVARTLPTASVLCGLNCKLKSD